MPLAAFPLAPRHNWRHAIRLNALSAALAGAFATAGAPLPASAAVFNFTGSSSGNWNLAANWAEGVPLGAVDTEVVLNAAGRSASFNDMAGGLVLNRLTLGASAAAPVLSGQALIFQGSNAALSMLSNSGNAQVQTAIVLGSSLTVQGGPSTTSQLLLQGVISGGSGSSFSLASGRAVLSGNNTYSGATEVAATAALGVAGLGLAGTSGIQVAAGGELQIVSSSAVTTLNAPIQLAGLLSSSAKRVNSAFGPVGSAVVQSTVTLSGDARVLAFNASGSGLNSTLLTLNGAVDRAGHTLTLSTAGANNVLTLAGDITGNGTLLIEPGGGTIGVNRVLGDGDLRVQGAAGAVTLGSVAGAGVLRVAYDTALGGSVHVGGAVSGARHLDVTRGSLTLANAAHSFSGLVQLRSEGTLNVARESGLGDSANTLRFDGGGLLRLTDTTGGLSRALFTTGGMATVDFAGTAVRALSSVITGDGGVTFSGSGSLLNLSGNNSFAGGLGITGVIVSFANDTNLGQAGAPVLLQSGSLNLPAGYTLQRPLSVGSSTSRVTGSGDHTLSGPLSGAGRLNLGGAARFTLAGSASHSGGVALAGNVGAPAVLVLDSDARLGAAGGVLNIGQLNGSVVLPGTLQAAADLNIAATRSTSFRDMTVNTAGHTVVFNQALNGLGMNKTGAGVWLLNSANSNASNTNLVNVQQGSLQLGVVGALGSRAEVTVASGAVLDINGRNQSLDALLVHSGGLVQLGSNPGTLLSLPAGGSVNGSIAGMGSIEAGRSGSGFNTLVLELNGANGFSGNIAVNNGARLSLGHEAALGAASNTLTLNNGVLAANNSALAPVVLAATRVLQVGSGGAGFMAAGQSLVVEAALSGNAALRFLGGSGPGDAAKTEVRLMNASNSFTGNLQLGDAQSFGTAVLGISADAALGAAANGVLLGHTFFDGESTRSASGGLRAFASLTLPASRGLQLNGSSSDAFSGFIDTNGHTVVLQGGISQARDGLALLKTGAGSLVMNGVSSSTGATEVEQGTLGGGGEVQTLQIGAAATLAPGESAGLLRVRGNLSFSAGLLAMELGGLQRGSGYDALDVGGSTDLGGATLALDFITGFENADLGGQQFVLVSSVGGVLGSFANVANGQRLLTVDGEGSFLVRYGDGLGLVLSDYVSAVPEPRTWALWTLGLLAVAGAKGRRRGVGP